MIPPVPAITRTNTVPFARDLARYGDQPAIVTVDRTLTYRTLAAEVREAADRLGMSRRLVLVAGGNRIDTLVPYLAALSAGHPVLLAPGGNPSSLASLTAAYDPDVIATCAAGRLHLDERRTGTAHRLHPDLALLLSTSGSTGSPKLVRLSHENVQDNAEAIIESLGIRPADRAATTLPMHYSYGLSVINSHLRCGATLILTELSVADDRFWKLFQEHRGSSFAGVPYTFELLDRVGFANLALPSLRYVTQAGGRLAPRRVREYAALGRRSGWDLFVMYGQTEATARMSCLPPDLVMDHPDSIGTPIRGGRFRLEPVDDGDAAELVYQGPNVMLGYAQSPVDLALGRTVDELHTGDLARLGDDGLYRLTGRRSRFGKLFGLRIDLQQVEQLLAGRGLRADCTATDDKLVVGVRSVSRPEAQTRRGPDEPASGHTRGRWHEPDPAELANWIADRCGLPSRTVAVFCLPELPVLANGKPDYQSLRALAGAAQTTDAEPARAAATADLTAVYAEVLGLEQVSEEDSFVSLGGDSLSYVEMSIRLERALGELPADWHVTAIGRLKPARRGPGGPDDGQPCPGGKGRWKLPRLRRIETSVALRAVAIVLIVGSHIQVFDLPGGAHVLLAVAGFNFARFHLTGAARMDRVRHLARSVGRISAAACTWILAMYLVTDDYPLASVFLANYLTGEHKYGWHFWFVEALVYYLLVLTALMSLPWLDGLERRHPYRLPMVLAAVGLVFRYELLGEPATPAKVFWLFALGWAAAKATSGRQRLIVSVAALVTVPGLFADPGRESTIVLGLLLLIWVTDLPSTALLNRVAAALAASSIYIYLTHWQIFRPIDDTSRPLALLAALAFGVLYARLATRLGARLSSLAVAAGRREQRTAAAAGRREQRGVSV